MKDDYSMKNNFKNQVLAVCLANIGTISFGQTFGWLSPSLVTLQSLSYTPLFSGPITSDEIAWCAALFGFGFVLGQLLGVITTSKFGLKWGIVLTAFPILLGWLLVIIGNRIEYLFLSRLLGGTSGGMQFYSVPLYVAEISHPSIRGRLGTLLLLNECFGLIMINCVASYVNYYIVPYIFLPFPIIFFILFMFIPNTPEYLVTNDRIQEAEKSIRFYKNMYEDTPHTHQKIKEEIENVQTFIKERLTKERLKLTDFTTPESRHGLLRLVILLIVYLGNGSYIFISFAASIFRESGSNLDANISAIVGSIVQFIGVLLATVLIDKIGRRALMIIATFGCTIGLMSMGTFNYLSVKGYNVNLVNWIPIVSMTISLLSAWTGLIPVTFVVLAELVRAKIRRASSLAFLVVLYGLVGIFTGIFPIVVESYGLFVCFWIFGVQSSIGILFSIFMLEETKGKSLN